MKLTVVFATPQAGWRDADFQRGRAREAFVNRIVDEAMRRYE